jgi:hypothetical protein
LHSRSFNRFLVLASIAIAWTAHAYTLTETRSGKYIRWQQGQKLFLAGNPSNQNGLSEIDIWNATVNGLQQWKRASGSVFDFDYWQGTDPFHFPAEQKANGTNSIFFASRSSQRTDPNVIGFTQVWFNSKTGSIYETDIILNDRDFVLTNNPNDTSSHVSREQRKVYLNNVVTHELGHAIGLSHSNSINSSMLFVEFSEQFKLGCDDWSAAKHLYPSHNNGMGSLTGTLRGPKGHAISGAVVTAISIKKGLPIASVHTDSEGKFNFGALDADRFSIMIDAYQGSPASIPSHLRVKTRQNICSESFFPKNFITHPDRFSLKTFTTRPGMVTDAGSIEVNCEELPKYRPVESEFAPQIFADRGNPGSVKEYRFVANGPFKITALGYLLLSPIQVKLTALDEFGAPIAASQQGTLYRSGVSDFRIEDSGIIGDAHGIITIRAEIQSVSPNRFPSPAVWPGKEPIFVISFNEDFSTIDLSTIPSNGRCESTEPFENYYSPNGYPIRYSTVTATRDTIGFCGTAQAADSESFQSVAPKKPSSWAGIFSWFFPFWAAIVCQLFLRFRKAKIKA